VHGYSIIGSQIIIKKTLGINTYICYLPGDVVVLASIPFKDDSETISSPQSNEFKMDTNPAYAVAGTLKMDDNPAYQTMTANPGGEITAPPGQRDTLQPPLSDKVIMDTNPAYAVTSTINMENNPAYKTVITNPGGGEEVGAVSGVNYYEDIIDDRNVKMTQNPAYAVP